MHRNSHALAIVLTILSLCWYLPPTAHAADDVVNWKQLGEAKAGRDPDQDLFDIDTPNITYSKIKFRVHGPAVHFKHVQVVFGDGSTEEIDLDKNVGDNGVTAALGLHGKHKEIKQVIVSYQTVGHRRGGDGDVTLWGYKDGASSGG